MEFEAYTRIISTLYNVLLPLLLIIEPKLDYADISRLYFEPKNETYNRISTIIMAKDNVPSTNILLLRIKLNLMITRSFFTTLQPTGRFVFYDSRIHHPLAEYYTRSYTDIRALIRDRYPFLLSGSHSGWYVKLMLHHLPIKNPVKYDTYPDIFIDGRTSITDNDSMYKIVASLNMITGLMHLYTHIIIGARTAEVLSSISKTNRFQRFWHGLTFNSNGLGRIGGSVNGYNNDTEKQDVISQMQEFLQINNDIGVHFIEKRINLYKKQSFDAIPNSKYCQDATLLYDSFLDAVMEIFGLLTRYEKDEILELTGFKNSFWVSKSCK